MVIIIKKTFYFVKISLQERSFRICSRFFVTFISENNLNCPNSVGVCTDGVHSRHSWYGGLKLLILVWTHCIITYREALASRHLSPGPNQVSVGHKKKQTYLGVYNSYFYVIVVILFKGLELVRYDSYLSFVGHHLLKKTFLRIAP